ncbi:uncharacterized protein LOC111777262 isoform X1 [Cucurbita pepo subsp. pepo]|uniref:uncharacterized protein LOC111777262 isoform X1 n=2 Tax=Cucurbita pepo subsp. pepo TaxID=3664 RepID=UPI000C9D398E|nr:uncharacterized protein LOC111777262 isoform X1 [Cucurbita pepo subsp. pepo]
MVLTAVLPCNLNERLPICRNVSSKQYGPLFTFSVKLTLAMQIIGFAVRLSSSLLWIQIYRLGISYMETPVPREADYDLRNSFLSPATSVVVRQPSGSDDTIGGSIYDPTYCSSLFEDGHDSKCLSGISHFGNGDNSSTSGPDVSRSKLSRHFQVADNDGTNLAGDKALIFTHDLTSCRQY